MLLMVLTHLTSIRLMIGYLSSLCRMKYDKWNQIAFVSIFNKMPISFNIFSLFLLNGMILHCEILYAITINRVFFVLSFYHQWTSHSSNFKKIQYCDYIGFEFKAAKSWNYGFSEVYRNQLKIELNILIHKANNTLTIQNFECFDFWKYVLWLCWLNICSHGFDRILLVIFHSIYTHSSNK